MSVQAAPFAARLEHEKIGDDGRLPVADSLRVPFRWICAVDVCFAGDRRRHRGSGVLIGPRRVLTTAHVLYRKSDGAGPASVYVAPARSGRADTFEGQSGAPVWMTVRDGRRLLVGIHLGARIMNDKTGARLPVTTNKAVHLSPEVVTWVRSLMPGMP